MTEHNKLTIIGIIFKVLLLASIIAVLIYGFMQITGLKRRVTTAENRLNESGIATVDQNTDQSQDPTFKLINTKTTKVKVDNFNPNNKDQTNTYIDKTVIAYTIEITNNSNFSYEIDTYSIRAKTDSGLLAQTAPVSPDVTSNQQLSLAPGGKSTITLYYLPIKDQPFTSLFNTMTQKEIKSQAKVDNQHSTQICT